MSGKLVRKHLEDVGLDGNIAEYNELKGFVFLSFYVTRLRLTLCPLPVCREDKRSRSLSPPQCGANLNFSFLVRLPSCFLCASRLTLTYR